jgi:hypothetical protein
MLTLLFYLVGVKGFMFDGDQLLLLLTALCAEGAPAFEGAEDSHRVRLAYCTTRNKNNRNV